MKEIQYEHQTVTSTIKNQILINKYYLYKLKYQVIPTYFKLHTFILI